MQVSEIGSRPSAWHKAVILSLLAAFILFNLFIIIHLFITGAWPRRWVIKSTFLLIFFGLAIVVPRPWRTRMEGAYTVILSCWLAFWMLDEWPEITTLGTIAQFWTIGIFVIAITGIAWGLIDYRNSTLRLFGLFMVPLSIWILIAGRSWLW